LFDTTTWLFRTNHALLANGLSAPAGSNLLHRRSHQIRLHSGL